MTGDISTGTLRDIAAQNCALLNKPVKLAELTEIIQRLLSMRPAAERSQAPHTGEANINPERPVIFVIDDDSHIREGICAVLEEEGRTVEDFATCEEFLEAYQPGGEACLVIDAYLPGMSGLDLLKRLRDRGDRLPAIMITGNSDVPMAVQAMKAGAMDFIEKPIGRDELLASIERAARTVAGFEQATRLARRCGEPHRGPYHPTAPDHGDGPRRPPEQEYRCGSRHQPAHRREPSRSDHEEDGREVPSGARATGAHRCVDQRRQAGPLARLFTIERAATRP